MGHWLDALFGSCVVKRDASVLLVTLPIVDNFSLLLKYILKVIFSITKQANFRKTNIAMV
jgi:hypothetical protein